MSRLTLNSITENPMSTPIPIILVLRNNVPLEIIPVHDAEDVAHKFLEVCSRNQFLFYHYDPSALFLENVKGHFVNDDETPKHVILTYFTPGSPLFVGTWKQHEEEEARQMSLLDGLLDGPDQSTPP